MHCRACICQARRANRRGELAACRGKLACVTADVVVVGAGVIGASVAAHLARAGLRVVVIDRGSGPGAGSTARATGGFRAQFGSAIDVRLSLLSREKLRAFRDDTGVDPGLVEVGYLWLASSAQELDVLRDAQATQQLEGVTDARIVELTEVAAINPHVSLDGIVGAAWRPSDGVLRPTEILRGYLQSAERAGVELRWDEAVRAIERDGDRIGAITTDRSRIPTRSVVNAAGPWAAQVARLAGVDLPVVPLRRQVAITQPTRALAAHLPLTIWTHDGFHFRIRDGRVLLLRPTPGNPADPFDTAVDPEWLDAIQSIATTRVPVLADVPLDRDRAWAGLYEMSPDGHAILGRAPGCPDMILVNGSSGHGVMHAPALGQLVSELIVHDEARSLDVHALRPNRFAENDAISSPVLL